MSLAQQITPTQEKRSFRAGTLGWTEADLDDPRYSEELSAGRYEILNGVLTQIPAAYFAANGSLMNLVLRLKSDSDAQHGLFVNEADIVIADDHVLVADMIWLTPTDRERHIAASKLAGKEDPRRARWLVPPTLIIESVSPGHERHDRVAKKRWYAEFGVPNYWMLDAFALTLDCHRLADGSYELVAHGSGNERLSAPPFESVLIDLDSIWVR